MKNFNNSKQIVFIIGLLTLLVGVVIAISRGSIATNFFVIYTGLTLIGSVVLHKEQKVEIPTTK